MPPDTTVDGPVAASDRSRFEALTGLRFVAALHVVLFHYLPMTGRSWGASIVAAGYIGVGLFFVLSGFLLTVLYARRPMDASGRAEFWSARFARIYPAYLVGFALWAPFATGGAIAGGRQEIVRAAVAGAAAALNVHAWTPWTAAYWNYPGWSVSVEVFFYAVFPLLVLRMGRWSAKQAVVGAATAYAAALVVPVVYTLVSPQGALATRHTAGAIITALKFTPIVHLPLFVFGMAVGQLFLCHRGAAASPRWLRAVPLASTLVVVAAISREGAIPYLLLHDGLLAPAFGALVFTLAACREPVGAALASAPMVALGEASYALYIVQQPLHEYFDRALGHTLSGYPYAAFWLFLGVLVAVSLSVQRYIEVPGRAWLRERIVSWRLPTCVRGKTVV
jgi:peptidoglycan/LPS O-acetylase OafA/YrhL